MPNQPRAAKHHAARRLHLDVRLLVTEGLKEPEGLLCQEGCDVRRPARHTASQEATPGAVGGPEGERS